MTTFPTLFLSHGGPNGGGANLLRTETAARSFLSRLGAELCATRGRPQAIVIASAGFDTTMPSFCADAEPRQFYDGLDDALTRVTYPAPGLPQLATVAADLVEQLGFPVQEVVGRGLDYGAFAPLSLLFPEANIPVVEMAIQGKQGAGHHIALGRALAPLRAHSILVIGSGTLTRAAAEMPEAVAAFAEWVRDKAEAGAIDAIADYLALAPDAHEMHEKPDHFVPLAFAFGAAGEGARGRRLHHSIEAGTTAMDAYLFE
jgi:4,5-DOPA dioxygenase extradiol